MGIAFGILALGGTELEIHLGGHLPPNCNVRFKKYHCNTRVKQQTDNGGLCDDIDDDGVRRGQMLSTVDRRPSPVDHSYRPALCTSLWRLDVRDGVAQFCWR